MIESLFYWTLYGPLMRAAHRYNWHYAPPSYPDGDIQLWCKWCGFRATVGRAGKRWDIAHPMNMPRRKASQ